MKLKKYALFNGLILAAGRGSRLNNLTTHKPKSFLKFNNNIRIIDHLINNFKNSKIDNVNIVVGYKKNNFKKIKNVNLIFNKQWNKTSIVGSLIAADEILKKKISIISYSDIVFNKKAIKLLLNSKKIKNNILILNNKNWKKYWSQRFKNPLDDLETFKISKKKYLLSIGKKTNNINDINGQFMGLFSICPSIWKKIRKIIFKNYKKMSQYDITKLLSVLISKYQIKNISVIDYNNYWYEIDNKNDYKLLREAKIK